MEKESFIITDVMEIQTKTMRCPFRPKRMTKQARNNQFWQRYMKRQSSITFDGEINWFDLYRK